MKQILAALRSVRAPSAPERLRDRPWSEQLLALRNEREPLAASADDPLLERAARRADLRRDIFGQ